MLGKLNYLLIRPAQINEGYPKNPGAALSMLVDCPDYWDFQRQIEIVDQDAGVHRKRHS